MRPVFPSFITVSIAVVLFFCSYALTRSSLVNCNQKRLTKPADGQQPLCSPLSPCEALTQTGCGLADNCQMNSVWGKYSRRLNSCVNGGGEDTYCGIHGTTECWHKDPCIWDILDESCYPGTEICANEMVDAYDDCTGATCCKTQSGS